MKYFVIAAAIMLLSLTAYAGKEEREFMKNEVVPAVKKAEAEFKKACGCGLSFNVNSNLKSTDEMRQARNVANAVAEGAPKHCTDADSRKAMCALKSLEVTKAKESTFTFKGGKGTATTDGQSFVGWEMITREVDK
jgi:hypothetical protein